MVSLWKSDRLIVVVKKHVNKQGVALKAQCVERRVLIHRKRFLQKQ
jgi:hypothetical protein